MFGRLTIRNLKVEILNKLSELASYNERSVEAEVRYALTKWTAESSSSILAVEELYKKNISERLMNLMEQKNQYLNTHLKASHVAERLGFTKGSIVEQWISGEIEPTFEQLDELSNYFSVNPQWLKHGDGVPFIKNYIRTAGPINELLKSEEPYENEELKNIAFIRCSSGSLYIMKVYENARSTAYRTSYSLDNSVGRGGLTDLVGLFGFLKYLYENYIKSFKRLDVSNKDVIIKSYVFDDFDSQEFRDGNIDPLIILKRQKMDAPWWEDVWENSGKNLREYWSGCQKLCSLVNEDRA
ncbi:TPA: helix-turn-helix transcriptional regulator [Vibrio parahaemolyticus]|nr:helix-turn-helix transcriptional regulator [Vibrio parahaemolyticus]